LHNHIRDEFGIKFRKVGGVTDFRPVAREHIVSSAGGAIGFKSDLFELMSSVFISPIGAGGNVEPNLSVYFVGVMSVAEDRNNFALELWAARFLLRMLVAKDKIDDQRSGYCYEYSKCRRLSS
jgi:hypothetical protein